MARSGKVAKRSPKGTDADRQIREDFKARLKEAMDRRGIPGQSELRRQAKIKSKGTTDAWMQGKSLPEGKNLARLCIALGVSPIWLLGIEPDQDARSQMVSLLKDLRMPLEAEVVEKMGRMSDGNQNRLVERADVLVDRLKTPDADEFEDDPVTRMHVPSGGNGGSSGPAARDEEEEDRPAPSHGAEPPK